MAQKPTIEFRYFSSPETASRLHALDDSCNRLSTLRDEDWRRPLLSFSIAAPGRADLHLNFDTFFFCFLLIRLCYPQDPERRSSAFKHLVRYAARRRPAAKGSPQRAALRSSCSSRPLPFPEARNGKGSPRYACNDSPCRARNTRSQGRASGRRHCRPDCSAPASPR